MPNPPRLSVHLAVVRWLAIFLTGCAGLHRAVDVRALKGTAQVAAERGRIGAEAWPFTDAETLERSTTPRSPPVFVERLPIGARSLQRPQLIEEQLAFRSQVSLHGVESNHARLYVYRRGEWGERPVLLWVPGLAVSELALVLLRPLLHDAIDAGFDVVFFVPPYHLERSPAGFASGDAVLATELSDHLGVIQQGVADLRETIRLLRAKNVKQLGVFGGSLGVNLVLNAARFESAAGQPPLDFLIAMIPLVDWSALLFDRPELEPVRAQLASAGVADRLRTLYSNLELSQFPAPLPAQSISVIAAAHDQVTPAAPRERWQRAWGIERVTILERGHGTMLLGSTLREEARRRLEEERGRLER